jgi:hypothetical protein
VGENQGGLVEELVPKCAVAPRLVVFLKGDRREQTQFVRDVLDKAGRLRNLGDVNGDAGPWI